MIFILKYSYIHSTNNSKGGSFIEMKRKIAPKTGGKRNVGIIEKHIG